MAIEARWTMFVPEACRYLAERILTPRIGLLWLFLLVCALPEASTHRLVLVPIAALFIFVFRLWDDLADLDHDRLHHPDRVLVRTSNLRPFRATQWALLALLALALAGLEGCGPAAAFLGLVAAMSANYQLTASRPALRPLRVAMVLAKYPAFILLMAGQPSDPLTFGAAAAAYLVPLADEARGSRLAALAPAALLAVTALMFAWTLLN